ncbi:MAG: ribbon-helix-helix protein, CopG family [SAR324 cluster bacterium]|uniref:Ribbon-helix-helix protein, CopG family n=1 Tax=SAR324 cluster bacterium TaxID=2024889 RepID=A0A7X9FTQ4_9DELT|nr:ribbon-helix-helix protein, CopG family [SAR324 cluster bacterium]
MAKIKIAVRIEEELLDLLEEVANSLKENESEVIRQAIREYLARYRSHESCFDLAARLGLTNGVAGLPKDLSSNNKYLEGFGK